MQDSCSNINWVDISDMWGLDGWEDSSYRNGYNFIDIFSGAGGLSCGLTMAGFTPLYAIEKMESAVETYNYNFITKRGLHKDIVSSDIRDDEVKDTLYKAVKGKDVHLIVGGFPCQGFSMSGKRVITDERNSLYLELLEVVNHIRPDFVVMENVEGLRSMLGGKVEQKIVDDFQNIGYNVDVVVLNSADYGVAQVRKRVIFVGNKYNIKNYYPSSLYTRDNYVTLGKCIGKYMNMSENKEINHIFTRHTNAMIQRMLVLPEGSSLYSNYKDAWKKSPWDKPSCTIKENHGGVNIHPKLPRVLTPRELAALQSFPDDFIFKGSKKWQLVQIGNAVPPLLGKAIGIAVLKSIMGIKSIL